MHNTTLVLLNCFAFWFSFGLLVVLHLFLYLGSSSSSCDVPRKALQLFFPTFKPEHKKVMPNFSIIWCHLNPSLLLDLAKLFDLEIIHFNDWVMLFYQTSVAHKIMKLLFPFNLYVENPSFISTSFQCQFM
jgi:hypothetical protein